MTKIENCWPYGITKEEEGHKAVLDLLGYAAGKKYISRYQKTMYQYFFGTKYSLLFPLPLSTVIRGRHPGVG